MSEVFSAALVGGLIGTFFGGFTKFLWENWLPGRLTWRRTQHVERELAYLRAPAILAFTALHGRLRTIAGSQASNYNYFKEIGQGDYYVNSTAYLVARAFAWREILRRDMASHDYAELDARLEALTKAFSHGEPGFQVFCLEQIEIGERMITAYDGDNAACMSYSDFRDRCEQENPPRWLSELRKRATELLNHPDKEPPAQARADGLGPSLHRAGRGRGVARPWRLRRERGAQGHAVGLGPGHMKIKLDGVPVWQRLNNGESLASVRSRLREREANSG